MDDEVALFRAMSVDDREFVDRGVDPDTGNHRFAFVAFPHTAGDSEKAFATATLLIECFDAESKDSPMSSLTTYCHVAKIDLEDVKGLDESQERKVLARLRDLASQLASRCEPPLYLLHEQLRENLTALNTPDSNCLVCLTPFSDDSSDRFGTLGSGDIDDADSLMKTHCFHFFHRGCLAEWFFRKRMEIVDAWRSDVNNARRVAEMQLASAGTMTVDALAEEATVLEVPCPQCRQRLTTEDARLMAVGLQPLVESLNQEANAAMAQQHAEDKLRRKAERREASAEAADAAMALDLSRAQTVEAAIACERRRPRIVAATVVGIPGKFLTAGALKNVFCASAREVSSETDSLDTTSAPVVRAIDAQPVYPTSRKDEPYAVLRFGNIIDAELAASVTSVVFDGTLLAVKISINDEDLAEVEKATAEAKTIALRKWQSENAPEELADEEVAPSGIAAVIVQNISRASTKNTLKVCFGQLDGFLRLKVEYFKKRPVWAIQQALLEFESKQAAVLAVDLLSAAGDSALLVDGSRVDASLIDECTDGRPLHGRHVL